MHCQTVYGLPATGTVGGQSAVLRHCPDGSASNIEAVSWVLAALSAAPFAASARFPSVATAASGLAIRPVDRPPEPAPADPCPPTPTGAVVEPPRASPPAPVPPEPPGTAAPPAEPRSTVSPFAHAAPIAMMIARNLLLFMVRLSAGLSLCKARAECEDDR